MSMELAVRDGQPDLVQPACPFKEASLVIVQRPGIADLRQQSQGRGGDVVGLPAVDVVTLYQASSVFRRGSSGLLRPTRS